LRIAPSIAVSDITPFGEAIAPVRANGDLDLRFLICLDDGDCPEISFGAKG
jgi:hypothetical protein